MSYDEVKVPKLNEKGTPSIDAFQITKRMRKITDPITGVRKEVEVDVPSFKEDSLVTSKLQRGGIERTGQRGPLHEGTQIKIWMSPICPSEVYCIGDLILLKNHEYILTNSAIQITDETGIPDTAPLSRPFGDRHSHPQAIANRQKYKTQAQLISHIIDHPARHSAFVCLEYIQPPDVEARLNAEKAKNIKEQILAKKKAVEEEMKLLEKDLILAQKAEETAKTANEGLNN